MNKNIIIAILVVIIIAAAAVFVLGQNSKQETQIKFLGNNTLQNGQQLEFELKDSQGNAMAGKNVDLNFGNEKYSVVTDQNGKGHLIINGENAGKYEVTVTYGGDDKHNGCSAKTTITVSDSSSDGSTTTDTANTSNTTDNSTASSDKGNSDLHYDAQYKLYYDDNGKVRNSGGQIDGMSIDDIRERGGVFNGIH